jgi:hypothetical protein|tara:strand:- start:334 stop:804 length:471 start_codon:yes stop_codon:yes gene_type:complete
MSRLSEDGTIVYVLKPADHQAGVSGDSIDMGGVHSVAFIMACAGLTGNAVLTIASGATAGAATTSETFNYRVADAAQGSATADTYGDWASSSSLTLTAATFQNKTTIIEIDSASLTNGQPWLTLAISAAASAMTSSVVAVGRARYSAHDAPTLIGA